MELNAAARAAGIFRLSLLRAIRLKSNDAGPPRRKRACPRLLNSDPQRGLKTSSAITLSQGMRERRRLAVPSGLWFFSSIFALYKRDKGKKKCEKKPQVAVVRFLLR